jgi:SAM-dependent methyltransferase
MLTPKRVLKGVNARLSRLRWLAQTRIGGGSKACNVCGAAVAGFYVYGDRPFGCPVCGANSRERFVVEAIARGLIVLPPKTGSIMHVAPSERKLCDLFRDHAAYLPCDLFPDLYRYVPTRKVDLMQLDGLGPFDLIYASHVMEHVPDDRAVFQGMYRVLRAGGQIWILVPMRDGPTEDATPEMTPMEREQRFRQWDHMRLYGMDIVDRMAAAGFAVDVVRTTDIDAGRREALGLSPTDKIFVGRKAA